MLNRLQSREETFFKEGGVDVAESEEREQLLEVVRHAYIFNFVHALVLNTQSSVLRYSFRFSATTGIFSTTLARRCEKAWIRLESFSSCLTKRQIEDRFAFVGCMYRHFMIIIVVGGGQREDQGDCAVEQTENNKG